MQAEDDNDAQAANVATAEQVAEMAEFDENFSSQISLGNREVREASMISQTLGQRLKLIKVLEQPLDYVEFHIIMLHIYIDSSLVPRPRPAFHRLQYRKAGEDLE